MSAINTANTPKTPTLHVPAVSHVLDGSGLIATKIEPYYRTAKVTYRIIDFVAAITSAVSSTFLKLSAELRATTDFIECTRFFSVASELINPKDGVYFFQNKKNLIQKRIEKVTLACHSALKMVGAGIKYGFIDLGKIAVYSIGQLPVFKLVTDGFYAVSSFFAAWDARIKIKKYNSSINHSEKQIATWERFYEQVVLVQLGEETELQSLKDKYTASIQKRSAIVDLKGKLLEKLTSEHDLALAKAKGNVAAVPKKKVQQITDLKADIQKCKARMELCKGRLEKIDAKDYFGLAEDLKSHAIKTAKSSDQPEPLQYAVDSKVKKWQLIKANLCSSWMKVASAVCKVAVITIALTFTAINLWTLPCLLTVVSLGLLGDSFSFVRVFYDRYNLPKEA